MNRQIKARQNPFWESRIFLADSIEMGTAVEWQEQVVKELSNVPNLLILNPRRDDWDAFWEPSLNNKKFVEQVESKLKMLERTDAVLMYFAPSTKSPITLLELNLYARSSKIAVCHSEGFWQKENVNIVCRRYQVLKFKILGALLDYTKESNL